MATEILYEACSQYVDPLLEFGWVRHNEHGFLVEREHGNPIYFNNDKYRGLPGEHPRIYPVIPLNDEHYLSIKDNPAQEVFNPFHSLKHMQLVMLEFKRGLITTCVSHEAGDKHSIEEMEELIRFHYEKANGVFTTGFVNVENEEDLKLLYSYTGPDIISATWGLCVTAYNAEDRRHAEWFYDIEKTWRKAKRLSDRWEEERRKILPKIKVMRQESVGLQHIDLSDTANNKISEFGSNYFIRQEQMDDFLLSLFNINNLEIVENPAESSNPMIVKKEKVWQYPDFASDEVIFADSNKNEVVSRQSDKEEPPFMSPIMKYLPELPRFPPPGGDVDVDNEDDAQTVEVVADPMAPPSSPPGMGLPPPNLPNMANPYGGFPPSPFGGPFLGGQTQPMPPQYVGNNPFIGPGMMGQGPFGNQFMGQNLFHNVPSDINLIDFESKDHPDPFSNYR
jgi:hypothetical protein